MVCKAAGYCNGKESPKRFEFKDDYKKGKKPKRRRTKKKKKEEKSGDKYEL